MEMTECINKLIADKTSRRSPLRRVAGGKNGTLFCLALAGWMLSASTQAAECKADAGTKQYNFLMNYTLADPTQNMSGRTILNAYQWSLGGSYSVSCSCTKPYGPAYITAKVPDTELVYSDGNLNYYAINDYLAAASEVYIAGKYDKVKATPFGPTSNDNPEVRCNSFPYATGSKGQISLYFRRPFVGEQDIPLTKIVDVYIASDDKTQSTVPVSTVWMSGKVIVPQSCVINGGGIVTIPFGNIMAGDMTTKGEMPKNFTPKNLNMNVACSNISDGVKVSLTFSGTPDANDPTAFSTTNKDIAVRINNPEGEAVVPQDGVLPLTMNYATQVGTSAINLYPFNTTGKMPETGDFTATATIRAEIQ